MALLPSTQREELLIHHQVIMVLPIGEQVLLLMVILRESVLPLQEGVLLLYEAIVPQPAEVRAAIEVTTEVLLPAEVAAVTQVVGSQVEAVEAVAVIPVEVAAAVVAAEGNQPAFYRFF